MRNFISFIAIIISLNVVCCQQHVQSAQSTVKKTSFVKWKSYTNNKYGLAFQYPANWVKENKDVEAVDRNGVTTSIEINFTDSVSKSTLLIEYHLAPNGAELYKYQLSQYNSSQGWFEKSRKQIKVAGSTAIEAFAIINKDGRGNKLNPSLRFIVIDFLDKKQTGEIELQFKTPLPCENAEAAKFKQLLSTFKFMN